jgi:hypothetical protein
MCCNHKILNQSQNGMLIYLYNSQNFQLTLNNLSFELTEVEFESLYFYLKKIDYNYWERQYKNSIYERKIPIPTLQSNFIILINKEELEELLYLLEYKKKYKMINYIDIKYPLYLN